MSFPYHKLPYHGNKHAQDGCSPGMKRLRFEGPDWDGHWTVGFDPKWVKHRKISWPLTFSAGHGGDEYGNCSLYLRTPLFGVIWFYPTGHYQTEVELPDFGESAWVDKVIHGWKETG